MYTRYIQIHTTYTYNTRGTGHSLLFLHVLLYSLDFTQHVFSLMPKVFTRYSISKYSNSFVFTYGGNIVGSYVDTRVYAVRCISDLRDAASCAASFPHFGAASSPHEALPRRVGASGV